ncbi:MAG: hypothetical protein KatS3mg059_1706 [Thermomicrobiales bacterium]|nr:MAG: hypothetical protein KatS3mg059_1706 [Thermomicrobiales bacterium]
MTPTPPRLFAHLPRMAAAVGMLIGVTAMAGWLDGSGTIVRQAPEVLRMRLTTAIGIVLLGLALWRKSRPVPSPVALGRAGCSATCWPLLAALTGLALCSSPSSSVPGDHRAASWLLNPAQRSRAG